MGSANRGTRRNLAGLSLVASVVFLLAGFTWWANENVTHRESHEFERPDRGASLAIAERAATHRTQDRDTQIRGSMTLRQLADECGLTIDQIREELGLPSTVSPDARLGYLRREYSFTMSDVRRTVEAARIRMPESEEQSP